MVMGIILGSLYIPSIPLLVGGGPNQVTGSCTPGLASVSFVRPWELGADFKASVVSWRFMGLPTGFRA